MTATYDAADVKIIYGTVILAGFAEGDIVSIAYQGDGVKTYVGATGETAFIENNNQSAELKVRVQATSIINSQLTLLYQAGNPVLPIAVMSLSTGGVHGAGSAKLKRMPDMTYGGTDMPVAEWTFLCSSLSTELVGAVVAL